MTVRFMIDPPFLSKGFLAVHVPRHKQLEFVRYLHRAPRAEAVCLRPGGTP